MMILVLSACGVSTSLLSTKENASIVGGTNVVDGGSFSKYAVLIFDDHTNAFCTGIIIDKQVILTAAHCVGKNPMRLAFGANPLSGHYQQRYSTKTLVHPDYKGSATDDTFNSDNDLALLFVAAGVPTSYNSVQLPDTTSFTRDETTQFTALGYGQTTGVEKSDSSSLGAGVLRSVSLQVKSVSDDALTFRVDQSSGQGICKGDSGGPALSQYQGQDYVIGIASSIVWNSDGPGADNDVCKFESTYVNILSYVDWIKDSLNKLKQ